MSLNLQSSKVDWLDAEEYPFRANYIPVDGGTMHYVDEGQGSPIVFLHGNPTWSFLFRGMVRDLAIKHRCIAIDLLGFGLSDKPHKWSYSPEAQARNVSHLLQSLNLSHVTLVGHEFGGPILLDWALDHPDRVNAACLINSWMWPLRDIPEVKRIQAALANPVSRLLNVAVANIGKSFHDKLKLSDKVYEHYRKPLARSAERGGVEGLARGLTDSSPWLAGLWARHEALSTKSLLILWGLEDRIFNVDMLHRWTAAFPQAQVETFANCGHFVPEECSREAEAALYMWLDGRRELSRTSAAILTE